MNFSSNFHYGKYESYKYNLYQTAKTRYDLLLFVLGSHSVKKTY